MTQGDGPTDRCHACGHAATQSWQRHATDAELQAAIADPRVRSVGPTETSALVTVLACDQCGFQPEVDAEGIERPSDLSAHVHDAECEAPPTCTCSIAQARETSDPA